MRKVRILPLLVFACMAVGLTACGFFEIFNTGGGDPNDDSCDAVQKKHESGLRLKLSLTCKYKEPCDASMFFGWFVYSDSTQECYGDYEYKFVSKEKSQKIRWNTNLPVTVDDDDHVRFSLFDSEKVEKTYDIDLSEIIHSYTVKDDSVEIKKLDDLSYLAMYNIDSRDHHIETIEKSGFTEQNDFYSIAITDSLDPRIRLKGDMYKQSSFGADQIEWSATLYWR